MNRVGLSIPNGANIAQDPEKGVIPPQGVAAPCLRITALVPPSFEKFVYHSISLCAKSLYSAIQ